MRYLKSYKKFETIGYTELTDEIWEDIDDILLELVDTGFHITKDISDVKRIDNKLCEGVIEIIIDDHQKSFSFNQIEVQFRRLVEYMTEKGWNYSLLCFIGTTYHTFECGGSHPLAKVEKTFRSGSERDSHKSFLRNKIKRDCVAFKIAFYQNISRIIE